MKVELLRQPLKEVALLLMRRVIVSGLRVEDAGFEIDEVIWAAVSNHNDSITQLRIAMQILAH